MSIDKMLARSSSELIRMIDSYKGYWGCRIDYTPEHIDNVIADLIETKLAWQADIKSRHTVKKGKE